MSSRKSLSFIGTNNTSNVETQPIHDEDEFASRLNIDDLPSAKELQVKVVVMSVDGKVKVRIPQDFERMENCVQFNFTAQRITGGIENVLGESYIRRI